MRTELELVIIAIMLLVAALVVLTIFAGGMRPFGDITSARSSCLNSGKSSCETSGVSPFNWATKSIMKPDGTYTSCAELLNVWGTCCQGSAPYHWAC
jgi:hypothetical protein